MIDELNNINLSTNLTIEFDKYIYTYISTDTCFVLPRTNQCGSGEQAENN